jgi:hypothetical protein
MSKPVAGLLIATGIIGFLYALAVLAVLALAATARPENTPLDSASVERQAVAEYQAARARCEALFVDEEKAVCFSAIRPDRGSPKQT